MAHIDGYVLRSLPQTGIAFSGATEAQSNLQLHLGNLSGPSSQVASKSQCMSLQASRSCVTVTSAMVVGSRVIVGVDMVAVMERNVPVVNGLVLP